MAHLRGASGASWLAAAAASTVAITIGSTSSSAGLLCEQARSGNAPATATASGQDAKVARLTEWLGARGADMSKVEVRPSQAGESAGYGLFLSRTARTQHGPPPRRWWWPFGRSNAAAAASAHQRLAPLAAFPLSSALTAANIASDPASGHGYGWMLGRGVVDERTVIMAYLVVERLKGGASQLGPWLDALPQAFHTPLWFTPAEMADLRGTTLDKATDAVRARLQQLWARIGPVLSGVAKGAGAQREPALEDLVWAHSVFWSRGQSLPVPREGGAASQLLARDPSAASRLEVHEGIVPGLDFCNHHPAGRPQCWWEVVTAPPSGRPAPSPSTEAPPSGAEDPLHGYEPPSGSIQLRLHRGASARPGDELMIDYGDKSNEELLVLYGFVVPSNPNDHVMLACPIAPAITWDEVMSARMELLRASGMRPQFFLRARDVHPSDLQLGPSSSGSSGGSKAAKGGAAPKGVSPALEEVLETLEVFVMDAKELTQRMRIIKEGGTDDDEGGHFFDKSWGRMSTAEVEASMGRMEVGKLRAQEQHLGLRMGALSTLLRLLELRMVELEDERQGTGSLEADLRLLQAGGMPHRKWCAVVYRSEQKRIVRGWIRAVQRELQEVMRVLQGVDDRLKEKQRGAAGSSRA